MGLRTESRLFSQFKADIIEHGAEVAAARHLMDRIPHVFRNDWNLYRDWKRKLGGLIEVDPLNITIIGSGGIGFSLNPHKHFRPFTKDSDIDVAVVSEHHFSLSWRSLRSFRLPNARNHRDRESIIMHRTNYIY